LLAFLGGAEAATSAPVSIAVRRESMAARAASSFAGALLASSTSARGQSLAVGKLRVAIMAAKASCSRPSA